MKEPVTRSDAYGRTNTESEETKEYFGRARRAYDDFFVGYSESSVLRPNGKSTYIKREYTAQVFHQEISKRQYYLLRILYPMLTVFSLALFLTALTLRTESNCNSYVMLSAIIPCLFYVRFFFALGEYIPSKIDLKLREYFKGARLIRPVSRRIALSILLPVVATVVMLVAKPTSFSSLEMIRFILLLLSGALLVPIGETEKRVVYSELPEAVS